MAPVPFTQSNFDFAVARTLTDEGVWSDTTGDRGGKTMYGITESLAAQYGRDVRALTKDEAITIYRREFWEKLGLGEVRSKWVAGEVFDTAVNMGAAQAVLCAQRACNLLLPNESPLVVDGVMGYKTKAALNALSTKYHRQLLAALNGYQFVAYLDVYRAHPGDSKFIVGWMRRLAWASDAPESVD